MKFYNSKLPDIKLLSSYSNNLVSYLGYHDNNKILFFYLIITDNL